MPSLPKENQGQRLLEHNSQGSGPKALRKPQSVLLQQRHQQNTRKCEVLLHLRRRSKATLENQEWLLWEEGQECLKREYRREEFEPKFDRLFAYYQYQVDRPRVYIREVMKPIRRYYYYQEKIRVRKGRTPIIEDEYGSSDSVASLFISLRSRRTPTRITTF
jgi:hypothetical protein